jgi:hypothetical protein
MLSGIEIVQVAAIVAFVVGSLSSSMLVYLTLDIKVWNSFHRMIFWMSATQLMYDLLQPSFSFPLKDSWYAVLICLVFGVTSFLISTLLGFSVLYVLYFKTIFNFRKWWLPLAIFIAGPNIVMVTIVIVGFYKNDAVMYTNGFDIATYLRIICLFINLLLFLASKYLVDSLTGFNKDSIAAKSSSVIAMKVLVGRLKYYALVQALSRVPGSIYEFTYGFNFGYYKTNTFRFVLDVICFESSIIAPVGFLIIYLRMQPKAMEQLRNRFPCLFCSFWFSKSRSDVNSNSNVSSVAQTQNPDTSNTVINSLYVSKDIENTTEIRDSRYSVNLIRPSETDSTASSENSIGVLASIRSISRGQIDRLPSSSDYANIAILEKTISNLNDDELIALVDKDSKNNSKLLELS